MLPKPGSRAFYLVSIALLFLLGASFGLTFSLSKMTAGIIGPGTFIFWQTFGAGLILAFALQLRKQLYPMSFRLVWLAAISGTVLFALPNLIYMRALVEVPAGLAAVMIATLPFYSYALALGFRSERFTWMRFAGLMIGFIGVLMIVLPDSAIPSPGVTPWLIVIVFLPMAYAIQNYMLERLMPEDASPFQFTVLLLLFGAAFAYPVYLWEGGSYLPKYETQADLAMMAMIGLSAFNFALLFFLVTWRGAVFTSQNGNIITITALIWAFLILGEQPSSWIYVATIFILGGTTLVSLTRRATSAEDTLKDDSQ